MCIYRLTNANSVDVIRTLYIILPLFAGSMKLRSLCRKRKTCTKRSRTFQCASRWVTLLIVFMSFLLFLLVVFVELL